MDVNWKHRNFFMVDVSKDRFRHVQYVRPDRGSAKDGRHRLEDIGQLLNIFCTTGLLKPSKVHCLQHDIFAALGRSLCI